MWFTDPFREVLHVFFNRIMAPYVENLDIKQCNLGLTTGRIELRNLRLKREALDKFRLPVDVLEGYLGKFTLQLSWKNLMNVPVEVAIEDIYLLAVPTSQSKTDPEEDERRALAAKKERLENAELLHMRGQEEITADSQNQQGLGTSMATKVMSNLQVTVKNVHIRYEDKDSCPGHPFAAGLTLSGFTAISTNEDWQPAFIASLKSKLNKLTRLESLAVYFNTDTGSISGLPLQEAMAKFSTLIAREGQKPNHQFLLKPVSGEGRVGPFQSRSNPIVDNLLDDAVQITVNPKASNTIPKYDVHLLFEEIGVTLDDNQYRDVISLVDMYHFSLRFKQYQKFRPSDEDLLENKPRALLDYAGRAILDRVHQKKVSWSWGFFAQRRDNRLQYVESFKRKLLDSTPEVVAQLDNLEKVLSYRDIRFYRSIARSQLRKELALKKKLEAEKPPKPEPSSGGWMNWVWGSSTAASAPEIKGLSGDMTDQQRRELYEAVDYDEKAAIAQAFEASNDTQKMRVLAELQSGSLTLRDDPHRTNTRDLISLRFDTFRATAIQRPDNFEAGVSLGSFSVFDGTTSGSLYHQIVKVKDDQHEFRGVSEHSGDTDTIAPFLEIKFEHQPLDERADNGLSVRMRHMEIIYHKAYVEAIVRFFRPPESQLESVEALLDAATQTFQTLRDTTRAGLEYALESHKTIDIQMDLNAPIIIIPEKVTDTKCRHLVVDAGHISIESDLVAKQAVRDIRMKRNQQYSTEDFKQLESLMYDKFTLKLEDAQFVLGNDLDSCMGALQAGTDTHQHLLERVTIDFSVQNSIVPTVPNLARFKVIGHLPHLKVNFSDEKYKALMKFIDIAIPNFGDSDVDNVTASQIRAVGVDPTLKLSSGLFGNKVTEDDADDGLDIGLPKSGPSRSSTLSNPTYQQHIVELEFRVDDLQASLYRSMPDGEGNEKALGNVALRLFELTLAKAEYDMIVSVNLRSLDVDIFQDGADPLRLMSSNQADKSAERQLMRVKYTAAQRASPDFDSVFEGIDQDIRADISTIQLNVAPRPVITMYDFLMTTFVNPDGVPSRPLPSSEPRQQAGTAIDGPAQAVGPRVIRITANLDAVALTLFDVDAEIAVLILSFANASMLFPGNTMTVTAHLGKLSLGSKYGAPNASDGQSDLLTIEGDNFVDFRYETFDRAANPKQDIVADSFVQLHSAAINISFWERPFQEIYGWLMKFAHLKGLYDAATQAAAQRAPETSRMKFDVLIKSPVIVFPSAKSAANDALVLKLGNLKGSNNFDDNGNNMTMTLSGIHLASSTQQDGRVCSLKIIEDVEIGLEAKQFLFINRKLDHERPDMKVSVSVSDINLSLTQKQYGLLLAVAISVPNVFIAPDLESDVLTVGTTSAANSSHTPQDKALLRTSFPTIDLAPEVLPKSSSGLSSIWPTLDLALEIDAVKLQLFDSECLAESDYAEHGVARFALRASSLRFKTLSDGATEAQVVLKSFTVGNTRKGLSKFREIVPAARHDRSQFMLLYTSSPAPSSNAVAVITIDSPNVIFSMDPLFALLDFFSRVPDSTNDSGTQTTNTNTTDGTMTSNLSIRVDLHDVSIIVLESDSETSSQAIKLTMTHLAMSQQGILAISLHNLGMSLVKMDDESEQVKFMDDLDLNFTMDSRKSAMEQQTSIEVDMKAIVFRASYRDIILITSIVNRAIELSQKGPAAERMAAPENTDSQTRNIPRVTDNRNMFSQQPRAIMSKEKLRASFDGFRLVLIGDLQELPVMHFETKAFEIRVKDWTGKLSVSSSIPLNITYWNLANSHWEPLVDPWAFSMTVTKEAPGSGMNLSLFSKERLDINLSAIFVELAIAMMTAWAADGDRILRKARGGDAPYRIRNLTGGAINVWSDLDGSTKNSLAVKMAPGDTIDWRFDDWKTMREQSSATGYNTIGIQFIGKDWEQLRGVGVDAVGEYAYSLKPRADKFSHRLLCEVCIQGNIKFVTLRSTFKLVNLTMYPLELTLVDDSGQPLYPIEKLAPQQDYAVPIEAAMKNRVRIQPDQGFKFKWSPPIRWEDLVAQPTQIIKCNHSDANEAPFRFQTSVHFDINDPLYRKYPKMTVELRPPLEIENLLPFDIRYRIYDKDADQNWSSYLRRGGRIPIHAVDLRHLILLNISVQDTGFKPSDFAIINTERASDFDVEDRIALVDAHNRKLKLHLNYQRNAKAGGAFRLQIFSPFIVMNLTGLPISLKWTRSGSPKDVAGDNWSDEAGKPLPFMLSHPHEGKTFMLEVKGFGLSEQVSFETHATETDLEIPSHKGTIHLGLSWAEGEGKYKLTKVVTISPRVIIRNNMGKAISFREPGVQPSPSITIAPNEKAPIHLFKYDDRKMLTFMDAEGDPQRSAPICIENIGTVHFKMNLLQVGGEASQLVRADIAIEGATIFVILSPEHKTWPFVIENRSDYHLTVVQTNDPMTPSPTLPKAQMQGVDPRSSLNYCWDFPSAVNKRIQIIVNNQSRNIDIMEMGDLMPFKFPTSSGSKAVSLDVRAEGPTQVLSVSNYSEDKSLYKVRRRGTGSFSRQESIMGSEAFEAITEDSRASFTAKIDLSGIGISLISKNLVEVVYLTLGGVVLEYAMSVTSQALSLAVELVQLDNQLHEGVYPVVLQPTPIAQQSRKNGTLPCVQASIYLLNDDTHGVLFVKYASILLQALTIQVDEDFIYAMYDLSKLKGLSWTEELDDELGSVLELPFTIPEPQVQKSGQDIYFEVLELQPVQLSLSFMRTERISTDVKVSTRNPLAVILNAVTMAVGNVNDAPLKLNALAIKDVRLKVPDLENRIILHYRQDAMRQIYRVLGSADFLGNPVGLFNNVSSGVADIFYEPFNGVVMHGNKELGIGVAKGAASFVKKTVFGFSDSFTKVTSSVGKGLSAATFDSEYQNRRRMAQRRNKPRHAIYGVTAGAEALATSIASGVEGVVMKPIEGAEEDGALGFFKGVGKGLMGVVTKPVVGVFDLASNVGEGIRNTTTVFDAPDRDRVRLPRLIPSDDIIRPYNHREALGQSWLMDLERGAYRSERYVAHLNMPGTDNVVILTKGRILSMYTRKSTLDWDLPFSRLSGVQIEDTGVRFADKAGREHDRFVRCPDKSTQGWFYSSVAKVIKAYSAQRRIDK